MNLKAVITIFIFITLISGVMAVEVMDEAIFSQIPYNYTSYTSIPANKPGEGSLGGYYSVEGKGKDFRFHIVLPGAEKFDTHQENGTLICYNERGLTGTGHIEHIDVTWKTLGSLITGNLVAAMFSTVFDGYYNMTCAAWTGGGNFTNDGKNFTGDFTINGAETFFTGNFTLRRQDARMVLHADYIYHPQGRPWEARNVKKDFYM